MTGMTQPDQYDTGRVALSDLSARAQLFDQMAANLFSGYDTLSDTPWVEHEAARRSVLHDGLKVWCVKQWPHVRASAAKHLAEAKRRVLS